MYFRQMLNRMLKIEKNTINKMYLNEINIKLQKLEQAVKLFQEDDAQLPQYIEMLNEFVRSVSNPKYRYSKQTNGGFKTNLDIFNPVYLDDLVTQMVRKIVEIDKEGITWGHQRFTTHLKFYQKTLFINNRNPALSFNNSTKFLMLAQNIDMQYRMTGKKTFNKYKMVLPALLFHITRHVTEEHFIRTDYYSGLAKGTFEKGKSIVIAEHIEDGWQPDLSETNIDAFFVLRKKHNDYKKINDLDLGLIEVLYETIKKYLLEPQIEVEDLYKHGYMVK
ncbi:MAG: hypothetical protein K8S56_07720 [Candidatus Cloacimonetes bacterium]|nr:hypothetical protein [Candidatus Cloacimonadota bacterium]